MWDPPCNPPQPSGTPRVGWVVVTQSLAPVLGMCGVRDVHGGTGHVECTRYMGLMACMGCHLACGLQGVHEVQHAHGACRVCGVRGLHGTCGAHGVHKALGVPGAHEVHGACGLHGAHGVHGVRRTWVTHRLHGAHGMRRVPGAQWDAWGVWDVQELWHVRGEWDV